MIQDSRTILLTALSTVLLLVPASSHAVTHVSNLSEPLEIEFTTDGANFAHASSFTTDGANYTLGSVTVSVFTNDAGTAELRLRADNAGSPGALIESLGSRSIVAIVEGNQLVTYISAGTPLSANTTYWVTLGETGSGDFQWDGTFSTAESSPGAWTIGDQDKYSSNGGATWQDIDFGMLGPPTESAKFAIHDTILGCAVFPLAGCKTALKASLQIKDDAADDTKAQLKWKWNNGQQVVQAELGNPATTAAYTLCIYDSTGGVDKFAAAMTIDPNTFWQDKDPKGWTYKDPDGTEDGVQNVQLKTGDTDKAKAQVKARGSNLNALLPVPVSGAEFFAQQPRVTVQLVNDQTPACWTSEFTTTTQNTPAQFKAKTP